MAEETVDVVIIDDHEATRSGMASILASDRRLRVAGSAASISDFHRSGLRCDVVILDLAGTGDAAEIVALMQELPVVVCSAADHWRHRAMAWACGAKGVLGKNIGAVPLADAASDAVHRPFEIQAQLARALLDAIENCGLRPPEYLSSALDQVARGRKLSRVLPVLSVSSEVFAADLESLRDALRGEGFGTMQVPDLSGFQSAGQPGSLARFIPPEATRLSAEERETLALYASAYSYREIAARLGISDYTVKSRILKAMAKLGVPDGHADVRMIFAMYYSGLHRNPELLARRLDAVRAQPLPRNSAGGAFRSPRR